MGLYDFRPALPPLSVSSEGFLPLLAGPVGLRFLFDQGCPGGPLRATDPGCQNDPLLPGPVWPSALGDPACYPCGMVSPAGPMGHHFLIICNTV